MKVVLHLAGIKALKRLNYYDSTIVYTDSGRFYAVNGKHYPGVSTSLLLNDTTAKSFGTSGEPILKMWPTPKKKNRGKLPRSPKITLTNQTIEWTLLMQMRLRV